MSTGTAPLPAVQRDRTPAHHRPADKHGALLVAAEACRIAVEFGLPEPPGIGVGPTGVIEAAMPMADLLDWQKILGDGPRDLPIEARKVRVVTDEGRGVVLVWGWFERRQWVLRSTDGGAW